MNTSPCLRLALLEDIFKNSVVFLLWFLTTPISDPWNNLIAGSLQNGCFEPGAGRKRLSPCWSCFFDLLSVAFASTVILNDLLKRTPPLCPLKSAFVQNPVRLWMAGRKKWTHPPTEACILGGLSKIASSLPCLPDLLRNLASRPWWDGYFEALACHLVGPPLFE